ncbi:hypothetical protein [Paenibacillus ferrarius]|uniref:hypothetical protein n=1 Tax=Paenibacillus ferrarius TaxID=1469647 RepID=UPI003D28F82E
MFSILWSKLYWKLASFKQNLKTLPGDPNQFDENWLVTIRLKGDEVKLFLDNIVLLIENGFEDTAVLAVISLAEELREGEAQQLHFNIFYNGELTGLSITMTRLFDSVVELNFITDRDLAHQIQEVVLVYESTPNGSLQ